MAARRNLTPEEVDELMRRYVAEKSAAVAGLAFDVTARTVLYHARKRGIPINPEPPGLKAARDEGKEQSP